MEGFHWQRVKELAMTDADSEMVADLNGVLLVCPGSEKLSEARRTL